MSVPVYATVAVEALLDGATWTNLTADVIGEITYSYGIKGSGPLDRVGDVGEMTFTLNNSEVNSARLEGYYTPGGRYCRSGFRAGLKVRLRITYEGMTRTKFYGTVPPDGISVMPGRLSKRSVSVTVRDWMEAAAAWEMVLPELATEKTAPEVVALILANMNVQPLDTDYRTGYYTFSRAFDTVKSKTRALSELAKVALNELGYIYLTRRNGDEVLRVEGYYTRNDERSELTKVRLPRSVSGFLKKSGGGYLLKEDGGKIVLSQVTTAVMDNSMAEMEAPYGKTLYNQVKATVYPRRVDATAVKIYSLGSYITISSVPYEITVKLTDPEAKARQIAVLEVEPLVPVTGYYAWVHYSDTYEVDITDYITIEMTVGASEIKVTIDYPAFWMPFRLYRLNIYGKGIYLDDAVDYQVEDAASIAENGASMLALDMKYHVDPNDVDVQMDKILYSYSTPRILPEKVTFFANRSAQMMNVFMGIEPGDRVRIIEDVSDTNEDFFVQGVEGTIKPGGLIRFGWYIRKASLDVLDYAVWGDDSWGDGTCWGI